MKEALAVFALLLGPHVPGPGFFEPSLSNPGLSVPAPLPVHDFWLDNHPVDPMTKRLCCGQNDCRRLRDDEIEQVSGGWRIRDDDGGWHLVETGRAKPSPDGAAWRCIWGGQVQCLFLPMSM